MWVGAGSDAIPDAAGHGAAKPDGVIHRDIIDWSIVGRATKRGAELAGSARD